jgi:hypothetical protein
MSLYDGDKCLLKEELNYHFTKKDRCYSCSGKSVNRDKECVFYESHNSIREENQQIMEILKNKK